MKRPDELPGVLRCFLESKKCAPLSPKPLNPIGCANRQSRSQLRHAELTVASDKVFFSTLAVM